MATAARRLYVSLLCI